MQKKLEIYKKLALKKECLYPYQSLGADILINVKWQLTLVFLFTHMQKQVGDRQNCSVLE